MRVQRHIKWHRPHAPRGAQSYINLLASDLPEKDPKAFVEALWKIARGNANPKVREDAKLKAETLEKRLLTS